MVEKYQMVFCPDNYNNDNEQMWSDINKFLQMLMKNKNICTVKQEDFGIIVIDYEHDDSIEPIYGVSQPIWLSPDEIENLADYRYEKDNNNNKD